MKKLPAVNIAVALFCGDCLGKQIHLSMLPGNDFRNSASRAVPLNGIDPRIGTEQYFSICSELVVAEPSAVPVGSHKTIPMG